ncbi:uncharacterized protein [Oscarella lobularis]|uniref:uncharacterized protein isoform X2 n=1 Tax=Oscarella lobularis TaxID=121494 RepID=UPI0033134B44
MGFFGAYIGVLMGFQWLVAGQERYSRCVDYYKTGSTTDGQYNLEILPRVVVSVYCKGMDKGTPSEYISLTQRNNYARYYKLLGLPFACRLTAPQRNWDEWGETHFNRVRFNFDSWLVSTNDFSYSTSVEGGSHIPYGQSGDKFYSQTTRACRFRGAFEIDLTSTPFQVDPQVTWSWTGPMSNKPSVSFSKLQQKVKGRCGGVCFPVLPSNQSFAQLKLRLVSTHPCVTRNPCANLGKCIVRDAATYECLCLPGSRGSNCGDLLGSDQFDFCAWKSREKGPVCQNSGKCENVLKTTSTRTTYGGDGDQKDCKFPSTWLGKSVTQCVSNCSVGPPFACSVHTDGVSGYVDLGWWSPGSVYTLEGWFRPTTYVVGRKTIMGTVKSCSKMGVALDDGKFALVYMPLTGCSKSYHTARTRTIGYVDQWHHVAMTVDGTKARLYVNGSLLRSARTRTAFPLPADGFRLGGEYCCLENRFAGDIKSFMVWKRVLHRREIIVHYKYPLKDFNTTHNVIYNRLAAHYDFCSNLQPDCRGIDWGYKDWSPADGDVVSVAPWNRNNFGANGTFQLYAQDIVIRGTLTAKGAGYKGGQKSAKSNLSGKQGESFQSVGTTVFAANEGGGGGGLMYGKPGGGGGYGTAGQPGVGKDSNQYGVGEGGRSYGRTNLRILHFGSGGGSGSDYVNASVGEDSGSGDSVDVHALAGAIHGGKGGNGGGALHLDARNVIRVTGQVSADGDDGEGRNFEKEIFCGAGGGGGAGGSIYLRGLEVLVNDSRVTAFGGQGGCGTFGCGGNGGSGRIRIDADVFTGETMPSPESVPYRKTFNDLATLARESISISKMNSSNDQSVYLGCFADVANKRHLNYRVPVTDEQSEMMTPEFCRQKCYAKNYKYYGVHNANQCFCDNEYGNVVLEDSGCNLPCLGNRSLLCGGSQGISTYGPIPRRPAIAEFAASRTCKPWCRVGFSRTSNQPLYGFCSIVKAFSWDFNCSCPAGVHGRLCELPCSKGKYGPNCEKDCECQNDASCDSVSGICNCLPGWTGPTCASPCYPGKFGSDCNTSCKCVDYCTSGSCPGKSLGFISEMESERLVINDSLYFLTNSSALNRAAVRGAVSSGFNGSASTNASLGVIYVFNVSAVDKYWLWLMVYVSNGNDYSASTFVESHDRDRLLFYIHNSDFLEWVKFGGCFTFFTRGFDGLKLYINESGIQLDEISWGFDQTLSTCNSLTERCRCEHTRRSDRKDSSVPLFTIIVSVISSSVVFVLAVLSATYIRRKQQRSAYPAFDSLQLRDNWEINRGDVFLLETIGQGAFGVVLKAHLYHQSSPRSPTRTSMRSSIRSRFRSDPDGKKKSIVACKMLKGPCQKDSDFMEEIKLMKRIGQHPHIVSMLGCITRSRPLCLIVEYCCHGDLLSNLKKGRLEYAKSHQKSDRSCSKKNNSNESEDSVLSKHRKQLSNSDGSKIDEGQEEVNERTVGDEKNVENAEWMFTASDLLSFAWQIASGMEYLTGKGLVHRDLACRNVLVCDDKLLKVSDFGLTRAVYKDGVYLQKTAKLLPLRWMSIEAITHRLFTEKSDVWSFGVVMWEICTLGGFPYPCISGRNFLSHLRGGNRLICPKSCSKELYRLMTECWRSESRQRPAFNALSQKLGKMLESEQPYEYIDLDFSNLDLDSITEMTESSDSFEKTAASVNCGPSKATAGKRSVNVLFSTEETAV